MAHDDQVEARKRTRRPRNGSAAGSLSARKVALRVLRDLSGNRRTARESIDALLTGYFVPPRERSLATELVMGVTRHRLTLARVLGRFAARGFDKIDLRLQPVLMLGAYQIIWLDSVPAFAAVNETVEQAKAEGGVRFGRFVNAVLRELLRQIESRRVPLSESDESRTVPVDLHHGCLFRVPVLPDPAAKPVAHLADATSHPRWLVARWTSQFGLDAARQVCRSGMLRPPAILRPNPLRTDAVKLANRLRDEGIDAAFTEDGPGIVVEHAAGLHETGAFRDGWFQVQDPTAAEPVRQMSLRPAQIVIDLCAGRGTKTTQMAEIMRNEGLIVACDKDASKREPLQANCERLGITMVRTCALSEAESIVASSGPIDWILIDAPCSNSGVLARRPEARYRINLRAIESLARVQRDLLERAASLAGRSTRICYSTCSIDRDENEAVAEAFIAGSTSWRIEGSRLTLPSVTSAETDASSSDGESPARPIPEPPLRWRDGGYWAILSQGE